MIKVDVDARCEWYWYKSMVHPEQLSSSTSFQLEDEFLDTADLTVGSVRRGVKLFLELSSWQCLAGCETLPRTEQFRQHNAAINVTLRSKSVSVFKKRCIFINILQNKRTPLQCSLIRFNVRSVVG